MPVNFTVQDILGMSFAIILFPAVLVFPGYVLGWILNIFSFKQRTPPAQYMLAIALSNALVPLILFLAFRFGSNQFGVGMIVVFFLSWFAIQMKARSKHSINLRLTREHKITLAIGVVWIAFCIFLLVDVQIGQRLYNNAASYDFTTRTALIEAITRTGVPPVNPTYYPGHFERITELYYFWYISGSVVDILGGHWVDARISLFAGITWTGLSLMAMIATYLRIRNPQSGATAWRASLIGSQLLAVSGLDIVPVTAMMIAIKTMYGNLPFDGRIEGWNMPVMSWLNALTWVPNHVASMGACVIALLALISSFQASTSRRLINVGIAGASIGSALGLSIWVAFTFGVFMAVWGFVLFLHKSKRFIVLDILASGTLGLILVSYFLIEVLQSGGNSELTGGLPISLFVRRFSLTGLLPPGTREITGFLLLPVNYFFELGFFFVVAGLWFRQTRKLDQWQGNSYFLAETLLFVTVAILLSFVKSTVLVINDLGMRGWLLAQFILIVWAVDIFNVSSNGPAYLTPTLLKSASNSKRITDLLTILLIIGIMTTTLEAASTRLWTVLVDAGIVGVPNELSPDTNLGQRTFDARLAYEFIRDHTPQNMIIQNDPLTVLDRPSGLYGTRQMVIGDRTAYGVPIDVFRELSTSIGRIFQIENAQNWIPIDRICSQYAIQAIIIKDTDPLWSNLAVLRDQRTALYANPHFAVFRCGN